MMQISVVPVVNMQDLVIQAEQGAGVLQSGTKVDKFCECHG